MRARTRWMVAGMMVAAPLMAQQDPGVRGGPQGRGMGPMEPGVERNIELALSRAETLGLDEGRVQELRAMQQELARVREGMGRDVEAFRQEARQQDRELREARRARAQALRDQRQEAIRPFRERYEELLTEAQRTQVRQWARRDGARDGRGLVAPGRAGMQRGDAGARVSRRGFQRGVRGSRTPVAARARILRNRALALRGDRPFLRGRAGIGRRGPGGGPS